jgi:hypothetical protein
MKSTPHMSARAFFSGEGYAVESLSKDQLHQAWITLQRKYHEGGESPDPQKAQMANMAYDVLKRASEEPADDADDEADAKLPLDEYTVWGWDGEYIFPGFSVTCTARNFNKVIRMARDRLRRGFIWPKAVLLQPKTTSYDPYLLLVYLNGHLVNPPRRLDTERDPRVDPHLKAMLSRYNS